MQTPPGGELDGVGLLSGKLSAVGPGLTRNYAIPFFCVLGGTQIAPTAEMHLNVETVKQWYQLAADRTHVVLGRAIARLGCR